ncbi:hypothetical protein GJV26_27145 [Massilia dura]|uniref:Histidine kinase domain-containing protein n=1 Tax=Pseudoduganella dura TaxID=321982 RepID=A0A6I3XKK6_9BURK|nr:ATP-binding protein [Pseudoduganella dura]MUI16106.1 hypothetical protein [Pseudoduganella dura]GGY11775.1 hypothetical protein GCM10007386_47530 [Pseudoduganella dura]
MRQLTIPRPVPAPAPAAPTEPAALDEALRSERLRCARDVHDIVLQDLTAVLLQLRAASGSTDPAQLAACLATATLAAQQGLASARDFVRRLRTSPVALERPASLAAALRATLQALPLAAGMRLRLQLDDAATLAPGACEQVAMIVREAVGNAAKHARASVIVCRLRVRAGRAQVQVRDDGDGFDLHMPRAGFGIGGMHERAALAGASLQVDSAPGRGTTIFLSLPLEPGE